MLINRVAAIGGDTGGLSDQDHYASYDGPFRHREVEQESLLEIDAVLICKVGRVAGPFHSFRRWVQA